MSFPISIICEGKSEANYITELNRLLFSSDQRYAFIKSDATGCSIKNLLSAYKAAVKKDRKADCRWIFIDKDKLYDKNWKNGYDNQIKGKYIVKFNTMNFEDIIMLHESPDRLESWIRLLNQHNHFRTPLPEAKYLPLFKQFFPDYCKSELPFTLNKDRLRQAFENLKTQKMICSDFLLDLEILINSKSLVWRV